MKSTPGMNEKDEKAGKTLKLPAQKTSAANKKMDEGKNATPPTKTIKMVTNTRDKKKNK